MIIAGKYEIPDKCPENCPFGKESFGMGSVCLRCPITQCAPDLITDQETYRSFAGPEAILPEGGFIFRLLEPEEYRSDWAASWEKFFKSNCADIEAAYDMPLQKETK